MRQAPEIEAKEIEKRYRGLLRVATTSKSHKDRKIIRKAFDVAVEAHKEDRRKTGEPYIYHPIAVARIVAEEMGLDTTAIVCALLHDTVEDTYLTIEDIETLFGKNEREIIDGLTKISDVVGATTSAQAENFRKLLLTISSDIRVILIKIADRLHNMRTLGSMPPHKQLKIASETLFMYAPLAHRLGLYSVKTELEDLSLKYKDPELFNEIYYKLNKAKGTRTKYINQFILPIEDKLKAANIACEIKGRTKSIFSIWNKMKKKNVAFEDVYDVFAIRIIIDPQGQDEKMDIWRTYSIVTDFYRPMPSRLRDWVSMPKANGYESLHTTVMGPGGKWVEVQIRSERMDLVAEMGLAAHWKYKNTDTSDNHLDNWLGQVREVLETNKGNTMELIDNIKGSLNEKELFVFTPKGDVKIMPAGATALDFAFYIHTDVGAKCVGVKIGGKLVPISYTLRSGDQVQIITSKTQKPTKDWLDIVTTPRARSKIKTCINEEYNAIADEGREHVRRKFKSMRVDFISINLATLTDHYALDHEKTLYYQVAKGKIELKKLKGYKVENGILKFETIKEVSTRKKSEPKISKPPQKGDVLLIGDEKQKMDFSFAKCCNPVSGDKVFGFVTVSEGIKVHRNLCPNATDLLSKHAYRVLPVQWASQIDDFYEVVLFFSGLDHVGLVNGITKVIFADMDVNMRSLSFDTEHGLFEGKVKVMVSDLNHLETLIDNLKNVKGVITVKREK